MRAADANRGRYREAHRSGRGLVTGGALLAHSIAGLLASRRSLTHPPCSFAPFNYEPSGWLTLRSFYRTVLATAQIYDRCEAIAEVGVPNIALAEYRATENYRAEQCPLCEAGTPITRF